MSYFGGVLLSILNLICPIVSTFRSRLATINNINELKKSRILRELTLGQLKGDQNNANKLNSLNNVVNFCLCFIEPPVSTVNSGIMIICVSHYDDVNTVYVWQYNAPIIGKGVYIDIKHITVRVIRCYQDAVLKSKSK